VALRGSRSQTKANDEVDLQKRSGSATGVVNEEIPGRYLLKRAEAARNERSLFGRIGRPFRSHGIAFT